MEHTTNYQLSLWEQDDFILMDDFNADNAKIDAAIKAANDRIDTLGTSKANAAALGAETTARESADTALGGRIDSEAQARQNADSAEATARTNADSALQSNIDAEAAARAAAVAAANANLGSHGHNLRIASGSYTGDGKYGSTKPTTLTFDFKPMIVFINTLNSTYLGQPYMVRPYPRALSGTGENLSVTWGDKNVSWSVIASGKSAHDQNNGSAITYHWLALGYDE